MTMYASISSLRATILLALGLTASSVLGALGCADEAPEVCADPEVDYATCALPVEPYPDGPARYYTEVCFDASDGCDPCAADAIVGAAIAQTDDDCSVGAIERVTLLCGPDPESEDCCYKVVVEGDLSCGVVGRPLRVGAERTARVAALEAGAAWLADPDGSATLRRPEDPELRARLRERWLTSARYEHASVAAFARVGLQLLGLGAPPALLRAVQAAKADEIRHARLCFGLAAAYGATRAQPGPLDIRGCVGPTDRERGPDLAAVLREAIFEGALGEGAAALEAREGARACEDPQVRAVLEQIAEDEQRHALLAYQTLQWALLAEPERAAAVVRGCLREGTELAPPGGEHATDPALRRHGLLSERERDHLREQTWRELVAPVLTAMLSGSALEQERALGQHG